MDQLKKILKVKVKEEFYQKEVVEVVEVMEEDQIQEIKWTIQEKDKEVLIWEMQWKDMNKFREKLQKCSQGKLNYLSPK